MKKVGIIGLGLIGGSIALCLKRKGSAQICGFDINNATLEAAFEAHAVDKVAKSIEELVDFSDIIVVSVPLSSVKEVFRKIAEFWKDELIVTDVSSLKSPVVRLAEEIFPLPENFIGGHPMAGSEKGGFSSANYELFVGRTYILTPTEKTSERALKEAHWLIRELNAKPATLPPEEHDYAVAFSSHLPHVLSWSIIGLTEKNRLLDTAAKFGGPSFRDITRVSLAPADLWTQILLNNSERVISLIDEFKKELDEFKRALESMQEEALKEIIEERREKRMEISRALEVGEVLYRAEVILLNKPGELASVTTALGRAGINIENIEMVHGEGQGLLFIDFASREAAEKAMDILKNEGYDVALESFEGGLND